MIKDNTFNVIIIVIRKKSGEGDKYEETLKYKRNGKRINK